MTKNKPENGLLTTPSAKELLKKVPHHKYYALMEFKSELELGISNSSTSMLNTKNTYYRNGAKVMEDFLHSFENTKLASGETIEELKQDMYRIFRHVTHISNLRQKYLKH
mgnify:CR=1 FL=1